MAEIVLKREAFLIIGACFEVHNHTGNGFLEAVYHECMELEFSDRGIPFQSKAPLRLTYKNHQLQQTYIPDFTCFDKIIIEIKAVREIENSHRAQILNYLRATNYPLGILINFGSHPNLKYERFINIQYPIRVIRDIRS